MLKTTDILDEKDKRLRQVSKAVSFPLNKKDIDMGAGKGNLKIPYGILEDLKKSISQESLQ